MAISTTTFRILLSIEEKYFGKDFTFSNKKIEIWKKESTYDELLGTSFTDRDANIRFTFKCFVYHEILPEPAPGGGDEGAIIPPVIFFKIFDEDGIVPYSIINSDYLTVSLTEGDNAVVALVDLDDKSLSITNEFVVCNAVITNNSGDPYPNLSVKVSIVKNDWVLQDLGFGITNPMGFLTYSFVKDKNLTAALNGTLNTLYFRYNFFSNDQPIGQYNKSFSEIGDFANLLTIKVDISVPSGVISQSISTIASQFSITISESLQSFLATNNINSLRDIRSFGGLKRKAELQDPSHASDAVTVEWLDAHAQLETLSGDYEANNAIIYKGYKSVYKISITPSARFAKDVVDQKSVSDFDAVKIHRVAAAHSRLYQTVYAEKKVDAKREGAPSSLNGIVDLINDACNCDECEAAISPIAYLADLLWYAQTHLKIKLTPPDSVVWGYLNDAMVDTEILREVFCQSFCLTEEQCDLINEKLCQYRIAIETLRCFSEHISSNECQMRDFATAERNYLNTAYFTLLEQMGTTYFEVRDVKNTNDDDKKKELADKLGLIYQISPSWTFNFPAAKTFTNSIDAIYIDPYHSAITNERFNVYLEVLFGFRDYTQPCDHPQDKSLIETWKEEYLEAEWKLEDANNDVYSLSPSTDYKLILDPDFVTIDDFRNPNFNSPRSALDIWKNRKIFIEDIYNTVFNDKSLYTPNGLVKGGRNISLSGDHSSKLIPNKKFRIENTENPANNISYTVENSYYNGSNTILFVKESIPFVDQIGNNAKIVFVDFEQIIPTPSSPDPNDFTLLNSVDVIEGKVEVRDSLENDGVYTIPCFVPGTITGFKVLEPIQIPANDGKLYYTRSISINDSDFTFSSSFANIDTDKKINTELLENTFVTIKDTRFNNGVRKVVSFPSNTTTILSSKLELDSSIATDEDGGTLTYHSKKINTSIAPTIGTQNLKIVVEYIDKIVLAGTKLILSRTKELPITHSVYTVGTVTFPTSDSITFDVAETLYGNEVKSEVCILHENIAVATDNSFNLNGDYTNFTDSDSKIKVEVNGIEYVVEFNSFTTGSGISTFHFTENGFNGKFIDIKITPPFLVDSIITENRKFTIPNSSLSTDFSSSVTIGSTITIKDTSNLSNTNNNLYTVKLVTSDGTDTEIFVIEPIKNSSSISSGAILFSEKAATIIASKMKLEDLFTRMISGSFPSYTTSLLTSLNLYPWDGYTLTSLQALVDLRDQILDGDSEAETTAALSTVTDLLRLNRDSFIALANVVEKYILEISNDNAPIVSKDEYQQLFNILISAAKKRFEVDWYTEEQTSNIKLTYEDFWISLTEPLEGNIDNSIAIDRVLIDPQLTGINKLPDMPAGEDAIQFWNDRNDSLVLLKRIIKNNNSISGFDSIIKIGLGDISASGELEFDWNTLYENISSSDIVKREASEWFINDKLFITKDEYLFLYSIRQKLAKVPNPDFVSKDEFEKVYQILANAYKKKILYAEWLVEEDNSDFFEVDDVASPPVRTRHNNWLSTKAKLAKWRSSIEARKNWQDALISKNSLPIIDADLVFPEDFVDYSNPAYMLWSARVAAIANIVSDVNSDINNTATDIVDDINKGLGIEANANYDFGFLMDADEAGEDIRPQLKQLHITYPAFKRLKTFAKVVGYTGMTPDETKEFISILTQATKVRTLYAIWREQESNNITLSPIYFKKNKPAYGASEIEFYEKLDKWRTTWKNRRAWEKKLKSRREQFENIAVSIENILDETEKQVLPIIRDGLVMLCGDEYATLQDNAKLLERRFLVDFSINCCQHTTRISHAIDVIQKLLWTESIGIDKNVQINDTTSLEFELNAPYFEEEWKWLGSYSTWRAAMFVFLYPENLLLPSLRPYQSPAFAKLVNDVRNNNRLTPLDACRAAKEYGYYFEDIANLEPEASCSTTVRIHKEECLTATPIDTAEMFFLFATRKKNSKEDDRKIDNSLPKRRNFAYYHTKRYGSNDIKDYSYWRAIEGLGENVVRVVGSSVYEQDPDTRHLLLFAVVYEELQFKLVYIKYDLEKQYWDGEFTELGMPEDVDYTTIMVWTCADEKVAPEIIYKGLKYRAVFMNQLNKKVKDWAKDEWEIISPAGTTKEYATTLCSYLTFGPGSKNEEDDLIYEKMLIGTNDKGEIWYKLVGEHDDLKWRPLYDKNKNNEQVKGQFKGAFNYNSGERNIQILFQQGGVEKQIVVIPNKMKRHWDPQYAKGIATFYELDNWMKEVGNFGLSDIELHAEHSEALANLKWAYNYRIGPKDGTNNTRYHLYVGGEKEYLNEWTEANFKLLFQAYQCLWDSGIEDEKFPTTGITQKVTNAVSWLTKKYIAKFNKDDDKASDLKWLDQVFRRKRDLVLKQYYTKVTWQWQWTDNYGTEPSLQTVLESLLKHTVANHNVGNRYNTKTLTLVSPSMWGSWLAAWDWDDVNKKNINLPNKESDVLLRPDWFKLRKACFFYYRDEDYLSPIASINQSFDFVRQNSGGVRKFVAVKDYNNISGLYAVDTRYSINTERNILGETNRYVLLNLYPNSGYRTAPIIPTTLLPVTEEVTSDELAVKWSVICNTVLANQYSFDPIINAEYLREAVYFVPMFLGIQLSQKGQYESALKWFKTVYNYKASDDDNHILRRIYFTTGLDGGSSNPAWDRDMNNWLLDPLNPHGIALTRQNSYLKYTVSTLAQTFVAYANAQFTLDTVESVSKAKELYQFAAELMNTDTFRQKPDECFIDWNQEKENTICLLHSPEHFPELPTYVPAIDHVFEGVKDAVYNLTDLNTHVLAVKNILVADAGTPAFNIHSNLTLATNYVNDIAASKPNVTVQGVLNAAPVSLSNAHDAVMSLEDTEKAGIEIRTKVEGDFAHSISFITGKNERLLQNKNTSIGWLKDDKQQYPFNYEDKSNLVLIKDRELTFAHPTSNASLTLANTMNPQAALDVINSSMPYVPSSIALFPDFCVPVNPTYQWLSMSIELNLFKIRNCMNIAGMKRDLDPYAAPTDLYSGLPQIGANGQLVLPGTASIRPTIYRYKFLLERAKQLIGMAQQVESAFLQALEKLDAEKYNLLRAKQDLSIAKATVKLKDLQVKVSEDEVDLAQLQKERSEIQVQELDNMINAGLNEFENAMIGIYYQIAAINGTIAGYDYGIGLSSSIAQAVSAWSGLLDFNNSAYLSGAAYTANAIVYGVLGGLKLGLQRKEFNLNAQVSDYGIRASQARRVQEWNFQKTMATQDIKIGGQQVKIAQDRVRVSEQDRKISELQVSNDEAVIDFLNNKFTNADLYDWMTRVLERVFSYYVSEATGFAKLAENQLAFERQETPAGIIQGDYWVVPSEGGSLDSSSGPNRRGLTSSVRMNMDIDRLVSYAMNTEQRKLQITKTFSLASIAPMEFQQFKETGEITFDTLMDYFDRDFPGHYLRLIKKVKVNVVALVPPSQGIKATLTSAGTSHVVIGGNVFQDVFIKRSPETIALSGNRESSGMFELQQMDNEFLNPFESTGVHTRWQFKMEKPANMFNYNTIADVLFTMEYTALSSYDYEKQVKSRIGIDFSSDRAFSFRNEFSDAFYQWTHLEEFGGNANEVSIDISKFDFPANVSNLGIDALKFYVITDQSDPQELVFDNPTGKGVTVSLIQNGANPSDMNAGFNKKGIISTLTNGGQLAGLVGKDPSGTWKIKLNGMDPDLKAGKVLDVIMVITYSGDTPKWI